MSLYLLSVENEMETAARGVTQRPGEWENMLSLSSRKKRKNWIQLLRGKNREMKGGRGFLLQQVETSVA